MVRLSGLVALLLLGLTVTAQAACRQALILGLDVSGSVDAEEYRLQIDGLAVALRNPQVQAAFVQFPQAPVRFSAFEWSGPKHQRTLIGWTEVTGSRQLDEIARRLAAISPVPVLDDSTAIAAALSHAAAELDKQDCWQRTFDISGDGPSNIGAHPGELTDGMFSGITVNALVIGPQSRSNTTKNLSNVKSLEGYFRTHVIRGPGAFVEVAEDHTDFAQAMIRKLVRELDLPVLSHRGTPDAF